MHYSVFGLIFMFNPFLLCSFSCEVVVFSERRKHIIFLDNFFSSGQKTLFVSCVCFPQKKGILPGPVNFTVYVCR